MLYNKMAMLLARPCREVYEIEHQRILTAITRQPVSHKDEDDEVGTEEEDGHGDAIEIEVEWGEEGAREE